MEIIKRKNYSLNTDLTFDNKHFIHCNFVQEEPFTSLPNITNCKFEKCNLVNCILPESNEVIDCNIAQRSIEETESQIITTFYDKDTEEQINQIVEDKEEEEE